MRLTTSAETSSDLPATSDAIFQSHTDAYDLFVDLSTSLPISSDSSPAKILSLEESSDSGPRPVSYAFADLPLYRSLVLLDDSPTSITISSTLSRSGGLWLLAFEIMERVWRLCVGVCEYAIGRGRVEGEIKLDDGDEDAEPLLDTDAVPDAVDPDDTIPEEDEAIRRARLILRQLHHHSFHLYKRLSEVFQHRSARAVDLSAAELKQLTGKSIGGAQASDRRFWQSLARRWGMLDTIS